MGFHVGLGIGLTSSGSGGSGVPAWVPDGGVLDLDFADSLGYNSRNLATTTPDSILTYTSPSPKLVYGSDGVLRYAPHNLLQNSNFAGSLVGDDFTATNWGLINTTGTATAQASAASPLDNAVRFQVTSSRETYGQNITMVTGDRYRFSFDLEAMPVGINWNQIFNVVTAIISVETYNGETANGNTQPVAIGGRVYIDFSVTTGGTGGIRFGCGVSSNGTGDVTLARPMLTKLPISGFDYLRNTSTSTAVYSLPIDHNPTTFEPLGVLIEEQRVNLLLQSQTFETTWVKASVTVTANAIAAPDGTTTADKVVATNTAAATRAVYQSYTAGSTAAYTFSVYAKAAEYDLLAIQEIGGGRFGATFDLTAKTTASLGGAGFVSSSITDVGGGWCRCSVVWNGVSAVGYALTAIGYPLGATLTAAGSSYAGDGTSGLYLWGAQLEAGSFPTSYVPTVASQVTRLADQVSILTSAFAYNAAAGTWVATFDIASGYTTNYRVIDSGSAYRWLYGPSNVNTLSTFNGSVALGTTIASPVGSALTGAVGYDATGRSITAEGDAVSTDANVYGTASTVLHLGSNAGTANYLNGHIKRLTYFPTRRSNADLQVLTRGDDLVWGAGDYLVWGSGNNLTW